MTLAQFYCNIVDSQTQIWYSNQVIFCYSQRYFIYDGHTILLNTQGKHIQVLPTQILQILTVI